MDLKIDPEWLLRAAEAEGNGITSVGGLVTRLATTVRAYACREQTADARFWYEVEAVTDEPTVIHTDGMFDTEAEAIADGEEWARGQGYSLAD